MPEQPGLPLALCTQQVPPSHGTERAARIHAKAQQLAIKRYQEGDLEAFYETLAVSVFRQSAVSVTLANPELPDCPLVGVSQGFESMTGYSRSEILGQNCRFLNRGCHMPQEIRHQLRVAARGNGRFVCVLQNRRKTGEVFNNLLHMSKLRVGTAVYLLGVQADVTHAELNLQLKEHTAELARIVDAIFAASVNMWAALQVANFEPMKRGAFVVPYTETQLLPRYDQEEYEEARAEFVSLTPDSDQYCCLSNTFIKVCGEDGPGMPKALLRRVASESALAAKHLEAGASQVLPVSWFRNALAQMSPQGAPAPGGPAGAAAAEAEAAPCLKSTGSAQHPHGCRPCAFFCYSYGGCNRGQICDFCHMDHPRRVRRRGKKKPAGAGLVAVGPHRLDPADCSDEDRTERTRPAPTPPELVPLLGALDVLSPLPVLTAQGQQLFGDDTIRRVDAQESPDARLQGLSVTYSERALVLARMQWKKVLPFIVGPRDSLSFSIQPQLPRGLVLGSRGVISGRVSQSATLGSSVHTVTMDGGRYGRASTNLHIMVLGSVPHGAGALEEDPAGLPED